MKSNEFTGFVMYALLIIVGIMIILKMYSCHDLYSCHDSAIEDVWNNGICQKCNVRYELRAVSRYGLKYYVCPECGLEVERYN